MRRSWAVISVCSVAAALAVLGTAHAAGEQRDGNWWRELAKTDSLSGRIAKYAYVVGFLDGETFGGWCSVQGLSQSHPDCYEEVLKLQTTCFQNLKDASVDQIVDGLDQIYTDYRNRCITLPDAMWLLMWSIAGVPQEQYESMVTNARQRAIERGQAGSRPN